MQNTNLKSNKTIIILGFTLVALIAIIATALLLLGKNTIVPSATTLNKQSDEGQPKMSLLDRRELESLDLKGLQKGEYPYSFNFYQDPDTRILISLFDNWKVYKTSLNGVTNYKVSNTKNGSSFDINLDPMVTKNKTSDNLVYKYIFQTNSDFGSFRRAKTGELKDNKLFVDLLSTDKLITSTGINLSLDLPRAKFEQNINEVESMLSSFGYSFPVPTSDIDNYLENSILNKDLPNRSPFGGSMQEFTKINTGYKDQDYKTKAGSEHYGIDLVPNQNYYDKSKPYSLTKKDLYFATCNGTAYTTVDENTKANVTTLECNNKEYQVEYWHGDTTFTKPKSINKNVYAGEPLGIMGQTGASYGGKHLHYVIKKNSEYTDPTEYIK